MGREPAPRASGNPWISIVIGTYEEGLEWVGRKAEPVRSRLPVELAMIQDFAGLVEDGNPVYWDGELSREIWGAQVAPAGLLRSMFCPPRWAPDPVRAEPMAAKVPLPGGTLIGAESGQSFRRPLRSGDVLTLVEEVVAVSPEKQTRLGPGHFVETYTTYHDDDGDLVATGFGRLLRFTPVEAEAEAVR
jgi:acyl dehydratase